MCDYSLTACKTRDAEVGDQLESGPIRRDSVFPASMLDLTSTRGFHPAGDNSCAVCLRPGTELAFEDGRVASFREINEECRYKHHDALEFANGSIELVHDMPVGTKCRVLQLPATVKRFHAENTQQQLADTNAA